MIATSILYHMVLLFRPQLLLEPAPETSYLLLRCHIQVKAIRWTLSDSWDYISFLFYLVPWRLFRSSRLDVWMIDFVSGDLITAISGLADIEWDVAVFDHVLDLSAHYSRPMISKKKKEE